MKEKMKKYAVQVLVEFECRKELDNFMIALLEDYDCTHICYSVGEE